MRRWLLLFFILGSIAGAEQQVPPSGSRVGSCGPYLRLIMTKTETSIGGTPARILGGGASNAGILAAEDQGSPVIFKILKVRPEQFEAEQKSVRLGELYGGPKLLSAGPAFRGTPGRLSRYYMELEHLFPGEEAKTAKDFRNRLAPALARRMFVEITESILRMMEDGVVPYDVDIMFTKDGRWRWIDTNYWGPGPLNSLIYQTTELAYMLGVHNAITFRDVFLEKIRLDHPEEAHAFERAFNGVIETLLKR